MKRSNLLRQNMLILSLLTAFVAVVFALAVQPSQAAVGDLSFTIEDPGVQASQVNCTEAFFTEDFESLTPPDQLSTFSSVLGEYEEGSAVFLIAAADDFGGAGGTGAYINTDGAQSYTLTLDTNKYPSGAGYFGFWWSAGNGNNRVKVNMFDGSSQTFSTQAIVDSGNLQTTGGPTGLGHYGNPNNSANTNEVYAYVNIFADNDNARIVSLEFSEISGSVGFFESDNHTACNDRLGETGTPIQPDVRVTVCVEDSQNNNISSDPATTIFYKLGGYTYHLSTDTDANGCRYQNFGPSSSDIEVWAKHNFTESAHQTADLSQDRTFTFTTQPMTLRLQTCQQQGLNGGVPRYQGEYLWYWPGDVNTPTGSGSNNPGEVVGEVFPGGTFDFSMTYNDIREVKTGVTIQDPPQPLTWTTTRVTLYWPGQIAYYDSDGFTHYFKSSTSDPYATMEFLPGTYKFEFRGYNGNAGFTTWLRFDECFYTNQDTQELTVRKVADPRDGTDFPFTISGDALVETVLYREIFPLGDYSQVFEGARQNALDEGWRGYWDGKVPEANIPPPQNTTSMQIFGSGSPNIEEAVNSNPVNSNEGNAFWSPLESRVVLYTEEYSFPAEALHQIAYETNHNNSDEPQQDFPLLKVDDKWYAPDCQFVHVDPDDNTGTWSTVVYNVNDITWMQLDIDPATNRAQVPGQDCVDTGNFRPPLATGLSYGAIAAGNTVQAFGLYLPDTESISVPDPSNANTTQAPRERFDNYTFIGRVSPHNFTLDDADPDDGDEYTDSQTLSITGGLFTIEEQVPAGWQVTDIQCEGQYEGERTADNAFEMYVAGSTTCTFYNEQVDEGVVQLTESYTVSRVVEGQDSGEGSRACYWVTLSEAPVGGDVVVTIGPPTLGEVTVDKQQVTLNAGNWNNLSTSDRSNFVCIEAVDDTDDDGGAEICRDGNDDVLGNGAVVPDKECGDHTDTVPHSIASSTAGNYSTGSGFETKQPDGSFAPGDTLTVLVQDNDDPSNCPVVAGNLVDNYCFEDGPNPWRFFTNGAGSYTTSTADPYQGNYAAEVQIDQQGSNVQLYQKDIALEPNTVYELSFAAYSTNGNNLSVLVHEHDGDFTNYGLNQQFDLGTGWAVYQTTFTSRNFNAPVNDARLRFWLAPFDANNMTYRIDYVILRKVDSGNPPIPPVVPPYVPAPGTCTPTPGNLITNPGYESGTADWRFYTDGAGTFNTDNTDPYECANNALVRINQSGANVQLYQKDISLQGGETYLLWLAARSSNGQDVRLFMHKHTTPYTNYGLNGVELDLSRDWQVFVVEFTAIGSVPLNDARLRIWLAPYDTAGTAFEFDMVTLVPKSSVAVPNAAVSATTLRSDLLTQEAAGRGRKPASQLVPADVLLSQGDFIDGDESGRLTGGYVPDNGEAFCSGARPSRDTLLPANGQMAKINIVGLGSLKNVTITGILQDGQPGPVENATFEGGSAWLRKAQNEGETGRVYTIEFTAEYARGQTCWGSVVVTVPEDRKTEAVFSGQRYDATAIFVD